MSPESGGQKTLLFGGDADSRGRNDACAVETVSVHFVGFPRFLRRFRGDEKPGSLRGGEGGFGGKHGGRLFGGRKRPYFRHRKGRENDGVVRIRGIHGAQNGADFFRRVETGNSRDSSALWTHVPREFVDSRRFPRFFNCSSNRELQRNGRVDSIGSSAGISKIVFRRVCEVGGKRRFDSDQRNGHDHRTVFCRQAALSRQLASPPSLRARNSLRFFHFVCLPARKRGFPVFPPFSVTGVT